MRQPIDADQIKSAIAKTGFPLEHRTTEAFRKAKWSVLSNRFYVDDFDGRTRELDLIAYKLFTTKDKQLDIVTAVLVSCKKDEHKTWALLSRKKSPADNNVDWQQVHFWTDVEPLRTFLDSTDWRPRYFANDARATAFALEVERDVFAFQEIAPPPAPPTPKHQHQRQVAPVSSKGATPQNDTAIFNAVTGLLKALDAEISALPDRAKGKRRLYIFSLAVLVDAPLVDVRYEGDGCDVQNISELLMFARFMVRQRHFGAQVRFIGADKLDWLIKEFDHLAHCNANFFERALPESYASILCNEAIQGYFSNALDKRIRYYLNAILEQYGFHDRVAEVAIASRHDKLVIQLDVDSDSVAFLSSEEKATHFVARLLLVECRYAGEWSFEEQIPF